MRAEHQTRREQRFDERFKGADDNNDGRLSQAEIENAMPRMAKGFAFMDENRDGYLSREELRPMGRMAHR
jgi:Ca2+-binding EF-hand superfamily protein